MNIRLIPTVFVCLVCCSIGAADDPMRVRNDAIIVRAIERMPGYDFSSDQHVKDAITRHLERVAGTEEYLKLAKRFRPNDMADRLQEMLIGNVGDSNKVEAANLLFGTQDGPERLAVLLKSEPVDQAAGVASVLGNLGNEAALNLLTTIVADAEIPFDVRKNGVTGLARSGTGQNTLLDLARNDKLVADSRLLAGGLLARSNNENVRERAGRLLPQPQQKDQQPLPPIDQLATMKGDAAKGMALFRGVATCSNCHIVDNFGKEVGPALSEIGNKLSREAMYTSILDPNAGISHNYETYVVLTTSGQTISGLKVSETPEEVIIRTPEAIDRKISQAEIEAMRKSDKSIMPENVHHTFDQQGLIDIVEYMTTLTKK